MSLVILKLLFLCGGLDPTDPVRLTAAKLKINDGLENSFYFNKVMEVSSSLLGLPLSSLVIFLCVMEQGMQTPVNI